MITTEPKANQGTLKTFDVAHLGYTQKTNLGSFYTPKHLVDLVYGLLRENATEDFADVILEPACGYGAFLQNEMLSPKVRLIGADLDDEALAVARHMLPHIEFFHCNALSQISRIKYGISNSERLVIVGNPPYNDVTSHVKNRVKTTPCEIDSTIRTRDLGLSFMLAMAALSPEYIAVLHPLSYLIKEANFRILNPLMRRYELKDAMVFNSQEFSETSKGCGFPIVAAIYMKSARGCTYSSIVGRKFKTLEGAEFSISDFDYVGRYISKYPARYNNSVIKSDRFKFYTMRDINALKRSRTFIEEDTANTIYINPEKLHYYCYVDAFKDIAGKLPYYLGNFDVMIDRPAFEEIKEDFLYLSIKKHTHVLGKIYPDLTSQQVAYAQERVYTYFAVLFKNYNICI